MAHEKSGQLPASVRYRCVLMPNGSLTNSGAWTFFVLAALPVSTITAYAWFLGAWLIFPFAGLELAALGAALRFCLRQNQYREVVSVFDEVVRVERGFGRPESVQEFDRYWARVHLERSAGLNGAMRLLIRSKGRAAEIGRCLTDDERSVVAARLSGSIGSMGN